ncbi:MAG: serine/threonine-protein phosphatase, partial [Streptomyces sp.]|nr:serine/threonine-protein phosphatase [Streptomyces sp.]
MTGSRRKRPGDTFDAIEPPGNAQLVAGVVTVTGLVEVLGTLSGSEVWLLGLLVFLPGAASALGTVRQTTFVAVWTAIVVTASVLLRNRDGGDWFDRLLLILFTLALAA